MLLFLCADFRGTAELPEDIAGEVNNVCLVPSALLPPRRCVDLFDDASCKPPMTDWGIQEIYIKSSDYSEYSVWADSAANR